MNASSADSYYADDYGWRRTAPRARRAAITLFSWQEPGYAFLFAIMATAPFFLMTLFSPALLSFLPTMDMIAPIAAAKSIWTGSADINGQEEPFFLLLLMTADIFADAPGRVHLVAKAIGAVCVAYPLAYLASSRFPILVSVLLVAGLAAYVTAPFAGSAELGLALLLICAVAFVTPSADEGGARARFEGVIAGATLFCLWLLNPIYSLTGFILLSACPFLTGRSGLMRYAASFAVAAMLAGFAEFLSPGINLARAAAASGVFNFDHGIPAGESMLGLSGLFVSAAIVIIASAIFGGREHAKNWISASLVLMAAFVASRFAGANAAPVFVLAAAVACFSVTSPFYDGLFRSHDRASVSIAFSASILTLFWCTTILMHVAGQFVLQFQTANNAPENIRTELALVQPGGPTIAQWIEEGRFSTPEAREFLALAPVDQSAVLLEAASRARSISSQGIDVAILTGADTACVIANAKNCKIDGPTAADAATIVFVPRLDLDPNTTAAKGKFEANLYTDFRLVEQTALWEIWVRRGAALPAGVLNNVGAALYR